MNFAYPYSRNYPIYLLATRQASLYSVDILISPPPYTKAL